MQTRFISSIRGGVVGLGVVALALTAGCLRLDAKVLDNAAPTASVDDNDITVTLGESVSLKGGGADPDCEDPKNPACVPLSFLWQQVNIAVPVVLENAGTPTAVFQAGTVGQFFFQLTVSDGIAVSAPVVVEVSVQADPGNQPPVAVATVDSAEVPAFTTVLLDGSASHDAEDGDALTFQWRVVSPEDGAGASLSPAAGDIAQPSVLLSAKGRYVFELVVTDRQGVASLPATVAVTAANSPPVVSTEALRTTQNRQQITLGAVAVDGDNDPGVTIRFTLVDFPVDGQVPLVDDGAGTARLTPSKKTPSADPALCSAGAHDCYVVEVVASDGASASAPVQVFIASLNNQPTVTGNDGESQSVALKLNATGADVDGDLLSFTWTQTAGAALTGGTLVNGQRVFTGDHVVTTPADALSSGDFSFEVTASDGVAASVPVPVTIHFDGVGHRPTLTLASGVVRALEGEPLFAAPAAFASDPDDADVLAIVWERDDSVSSPLFPATLFGEEPDVIAPAFSSLVASGSTTAVYRIHASDGNPDHDTAEQLLTVVVAPNPTSQPGIWVSSSPIAADDDTCGASLSPCATIEHALARIAAEVAAGTDEAALSLQLTTGSFPLTGPVTWPAGISMSGGFDPDTFVGEAGATIVDLDIPGGVGLTLSSAVQGAVFDGVEIAGHDRVDAATTVIACDDCGATFTRSAITLTSASTLANAELVALDVRGAGAEVDLGTDGAGGGGVAGLDIAVVPPPANLVPGSQFVIAIRARDAAHVVVRNSRCDVTNNTFGSSATCISLINARGDVARSLFTTRGSGLGQLGVGLVSSTATVVNCMMRFGGGRANAVNVAGGSQASVLFNTFEGPGVGDGGVVGVVAGGPVLLMGNVIHGFTISMNSGTSVPNILVDNVFDPGRTALGCDFAPAAATGEELNIGPGTGCNGASGVAWSGNTSAVCEVIDRPAGDLHLNRAAAGNACVGSASSTSAAGSAPALDFDGEARGASLDRGADDVTD